MLEFFMIHRFVLLFSKTNNLVRLVMYDNHNVVGLLEDDDVLPLSTKSRLNQRYLSQQAGYQGHHQQGEMADGRSSSIPDISELSPIMNAGGERPHPAWQRKLGLSASALNERYFDDGSTGGADDGARGSTGSMPVTEQTIEPQHKFARDRPPAARPDYRYPPHPKSKRSAQAPGPALGSGSQSSRATRVGPGEYTRSSAMSDCSEAPSLASHVRHVKVQQLHEVGISASLQ